MSQEEGHIDWASRQKKISQEINPNSPKQKKSYSKTQNTMAIIKLKCPFCQGEIMNNYKSNPHLGKCLSCHRMLGI